MISGVKHWDDRSRYYSQTNNSIEGLLKKTGRTWLETCGPTTAVMCLDMLGYSVSVVTPGGWRPQAEDVLTLAMNDPRLEAERFGIRRGVGAIPGNRVPQYYPWAVKLVYGADARFELPLTWLMLTMHLCEGRAVQICRVQPGHYQGAVAYDRDTREVIYHDPWPEGAGGDGFALRMTEAQWISEYHNWGVVYTAP